jgi:N-acylneuraminate cytidylyltransferase
MLAIIPARSGSKGVPGKNINLLGGHPLIAFSIIAAKMTPGIDRVIVSTDSAEYAAIANKYGAETPFLRPAEISGDKSTDMDLFIHSLKWLSENEKTVPEFLMHLRPTTPLRDPLVLDKAIETFFSKEHELTSLRSVHEMSESAYKSFEISSQGFLATIGSVESGEKANLPRQAFPKTYVANGYVDVLDPNYILKENKLHGDKILAFQTPVVTEVDSIEDLEYIEWQVTKQPNLLKTVFGDK